MNLREAVPMLAVAVAVCAAVVDVKSGRIPNRLTYSAACAGLVLQALLHGPRGVALSAEGTLCFGGVFLLFYLVRAMGAGDVKLAAALGSIVGLSGTVPLMFATALAGAALALWFMVLSRRVIETLKNTFHLLGFHAVHGLHAHRVLNIDNPTVSRMPYGLAFAVGSVYWATSVLWR
jgi:prepilin peptidase CpaA